MVEIVEADLAHVYDEQACNPANEPSMHNPTMIITTATVGPDFNNNIAWLALDSGNDQSQRIELNMCRLIAGFGGTSKGAQNFSNKLCAELRKLEQEHDEQNEDNKDDEPPLQRTPVCMSHQGDGKTMYALNLRNPGVRELLCQHNPSREEEAAVVSELALRQYEWYEWYMTVLQYEWYMSGMSDDISVR